MFTFCRWVKTARLFEGLYSFHFRGHALQNIVDPETSVSNHLKT